jgi:tetratricopeptide (TPR) repeat protein
MSRRTFGQRMRYLGLKWRAMASLALGLNDAAARVFEQMLVEFPLDTYAMASLAHLLSQAGRRREAIELLGALTAKDDSDAHSWFNLGFMLEQERDFYRAEAALRRATELSPQLDRAWYGLGLVLIQMRRFDEAVEALKRNTELQPMSPYGWYQLARVHVDRHDPDEAVKIIRHLKGFEPKVAAQLERETGLLAGQRAS